MLANCKSCGVEILFIISAKNKRPIPVDPRVVTMDEAHFEKTQGRLTLVTDNGVVLARPHMGVAGYVPHWTTCAQVTQFKKGGRQWRA